MERLKFAGQCTLGVVLIPAFVFIFATFVVIKFISETIAESWEYNL